MKAEHVNPFIVSAMDVLQTLGFRVERDGLRLHTSPVSGHEVNVAIGITGDIQGQVIVGMAQATALAVARGMIPYEVPEFNELAKSSIQELTNMLGGNASSALGQLGLKTNLSVPSMFLGKEVMISTGSSQNVVVPFRLRSPQGQDGRMDLMVVLAEQAG